MSEFMDRLYAIEEDEIHLFFLIDCSESMIGAPIQEVNKAMTIMLPTMVEVALAKEVMLMFHVLGYNDTVHWLCGSTAEDGVPMDQFQWHEISAGGGKNTAGAIRAILPGLSRRKVPHTYINPIMILITDGKNDSAENISQATLSLVERMISEFPGPYHEADSWVNTARIAFGVEGYNPQPLEVFASSGRIYEMDELGFAIGDPELQKLVFPLDQAACRIADVLRVATKPLYS